MATLPFRLTFVPLAGAHLGGGEAGVVREGHVGRLVGAGALLLQPSGDANGKE